MHLDALTQEESDIDWFAVDADGHVLYLASGGGQLPPSVAADEQALLTLHQYFLTCPETAGAALVQAEPAAARSGRSAAGFVRYARRGLFAFDKTNLRDTHDPHYHLVARPATPLTLAELPGPVAACLLRTQLPTAIAGLTALTVADVA